MPFLDDYSALWLLGFDMVPMMNNRHKQQQEMKLFISRGSNCTMESLFVQKTDSVVPSDPKMFCPPTFTDQIFPITFTKIGGEQQQMISTKALTDANFTNILVALLSVQKDNSTKTEVSFKIGTDTDLEVAFSPLMMIGMTGSCNENDDITNYPSSSSSSKSFQHNGTRLPRRAGIYLLKLDIVLTKHCYVLTLDGTTLDGPKCPDS
ncbi:hypothetical protein niasHT_000503 [Heterodera trifolii]|uniref:Uncharacterized protein n=1 Tax=Heterodera trifolii TaxID=157864 RepID=A0ABD2LU26_9BILA